MIHRVYSYLISIKIIPEQSRKMQNDRESLPNLLTIPRKPFALVFDFSAFLGENDWAGRTLIAVYIHMVDQGQSLEN